MIAHLLRSSVRTLVGALFVTAALIILLTYVVQDPWPIAENPERLESWVGLLLPLVFGGLGAMVLRAGLPEVTVPIRLYRTGDEAAGRVARLTLVTNERINGRHPTRVLYSFFDEGGVEHHGAIKTLDDSLLGVVEEGSAVTVLHDPQSPGQSTLLAALGPGVHDPRLTGREPDDGWPASPGVPAGSMREHRARTPQTTEER